MFGTTRVGQYQKKHSPTHTHPGDLSGNTMSMTSTMACQKVDHLTIYIVQPGLISRTVKIQMTHSQTLVWNNRSMSSHLRNLVLALSAIHVYCLSVIWNKTITTYISTSDNQLLSRHSTNGITHQQHLPSASCLYHVTSFQCLAVGPSLYLVW